MSISKERWIQIIEIGNILLTVGLLYDGTAQALYTYFIYRNRHH